MKLKRSSMAWLLAIITIGLLTSCASLAKSNGQASAHKYPISFQSTHKKAIAGNPDAEYALGYMYYYGQGIPRNPEKARSWISKAAAQGQIQAVQAMQLLDQSQHPHVGATQSLHPRQRQTDRQPHVNVRHVTKHKPLYPRAGKNFRHPAYPSNNPPAPNLTPTEKQLLKQPADAYTLQLLGSYKPSDLQQFIRTHQLKNKAQVYHTYFRGKDWYVLILGNYKTFHQAEAAIKQLPPSLQKQHPWVKPMAIVQHGITMKTPAA